MGQILPNGAKGREILRAATADAVFAALGSDSRYQASNADLTALSGLGTTSFGRQLLTRTDAAAVRSYIGAGTSNSTFGGTFGELSGKPTTIGGYGISDALTSSQIAALYQPLDSDLTAIAALSTTAYGRAFLALADQAALLALLGSNVVNQPFSETITWTGTTAPSGTATTRFQWYAIGKIVFFEFRFEWTVNGASLTAAQWPFPSGLPSPATMTGQSNSEVLIFGFGGAGVSGVGGTNTASVTEARVQLSSTGSLEGRIRFANSNAGAVYLAGFYRCL